MIGALLVLEHDGHVAPGVQVATGDVDDGSPGDGPSAGLQADQSGDLGIKGQGQRKIVQSDASIKIMSTNHIAVREQNRNKRRS